MSHTVNVRITDEQAKKIKKTGMKYSEYIRRAIDFYDLRKHEGVTNYKIDTIYECIQILIDHRDAVQEELISEAYKNLYKNDENVKKEDDENLYKSDENVKNLYKKSENVKNGVKKSYPQNLYNSDENVKKIRSEELFSTYKPYFELLSKMLNMHNNVPEETKKKITSETNTKMSELTDFLFDYKKEIMETDYDFSGKIVKMSYEDGSERKKF